MDKQTLKSLERYIQTYAGMARERMESYSPLAILRPDAFLLNRHSLEYWPKGWQHGKPSVLTEVGWNEIVDMIMTLPPSARLEIDYSASLEWLVCFHLFSKRRMKVNYEWVERPMYTPERAEQHKAEILRDWGCPWLEKLWNGDAAGTLVKEFLTDKPQSEIITVGDMQKVAQHIPLN